MRQVRNRPDFRGMHKTAFFQHLHMLDNGSHSDS
jgi:hypothetical protein